MLGRGHLHLLAFQAVVAAHIHGTGTGTGTGTGAGWDQDNLFTVRAGRCCCHMHLVGGSRHPP